MASYKVAVIHKRPGPDKRQLAGVTVEALDIDVFTPAARDPKQAVVATALTDEAGVATFVGITGDEHIFRARISEPHEIQRVSVSAGTEICYDAIIHADGTGTHATIQDALDDLSSGGTILICPGTYTEELTITGAHDGLTLVGLNRDDTTITGLTSGTNNVIDIASGMAEMRIENLSIRNRNTRACVDIGGADGHIYITNCWFQGGDFGVRGLGLTGSDLIIERCLFEGLGTTLNTAISIRTGNCKISRNHFSSSLTRGIILDNGGEAIITDNTWLAWLDFCIRAETWTGVIISNNHIGGGSDDGAVIEILDSTARFTITGNVVNISNADNARFIKMESLSFIDESVIANNVYKNASTGALGITMDTVLGSRGLLTIIGNYIQSTDSNIRVALPGFAEGQPGLLISSNTLRVTSDAVNIVMDDVNDFVISNNRIFGSPGTGGGNTPDVTNAISHAATNYRGIIIGNMCRMKAGVTNLVDDGIATLVPAGTNYNYND